MSATSAGASEERMPAGIPYIVANEFAERFCYYGVNSILTIYMTERLHFGQAQATVWQSLFKFGAYFFPLIGAIISDVFWGKFRTIMTLALVYCAGCAILATGGGASTLVPGLFLMAIGTGGIKPCVSTNVGDQFTSKNQHLIERAFSYFYLSINAGSSISIFFCPIWLHDYGPRVAFGIPAAMMFLATLVFWLGRKRFVVVPPAMTRNNTRGVLLFALALVPVLAVTVLVYTHASPGYRTILALLSLVGQLIALVAVCLNSGLRRRLPAEFVGWLEQSFTGDALKMVGRMAVISYVFVAGFWALWEQSNGQTWTLQATSDLMDKHLFGFLAGVPGLERLAAYEMLPAQIQVVNGLFILAMVPVFTFGIYPLWGRFFKVTPLRKIGLGLFTVAASYLIVAWIEDRIMHGQTVSLWWQILAYVVLTAAEVLVSITALEFFYKQAPLRMKSFIMAAMYLFATAVGDVYIAQVNTQMVRPLAAASITAGADTWVGLADVSHLQAGQKIDFDGDNGLTVAGDDGRPAQLAGTYLVAQVDPAQRRVRIVDAIHRRPVASSGSFKPETSSVSTYRLVGPMYFLFFAAAMAGLAVLFVFVALAYQERTYVRQDGDAAAAA